MTGAVDWIGTVGDVWAQEWRRTDRSLADLSRHFDAAILAAAPTGPFRAIDIGCGAGTTSLALGGAVPDATITGIDLSPALVAIARARAGPGGPTFVVGDMTDIRPRAPAQAGALAADSTPFAAAPAFAGARGGAEAAHPADLLYSRHGVMFFDDPVAAFTTLRSAARPGARLIFSCFRDWQENAFARDVAGAVGGAPPEGGPGPFAFADRQKVASILSAAGWRDSNATPVDFAYRAGAGEYPVADALSFLRRIGPAAGILRAAPSEDRASLLSRVRVVVERHRLADTVDFPAAAWIWSATA